MRLIRGVERGVAAVSQLQELRFPNLTAGEFGVESGSDDLVALCGERGIRLVFANGYGGQVSR